MNRSKQVLGSSTIAEQVSTPDPTRPTTEPPAVDSLTWAGDLAVPGNGRIQGRVTMADIPSEEAGELPSTAGRDVAASGGRR